MLSHRLAELMKGAFGRSPRKGRGMKRRATTLLWPSLERLEDRTVLSFMAPVSYPVRHRPEAIDTAGLQWRRPCRPRHYQFRNEHRERGAGQRRRHLRGRLELPPRCFPGLALHRVQAGTLTSADFNGDGKLDLASSAARTAVILLGNGDGTFQAPLTTYARPERHPHLGGRLQRRRPRRPRRRPTTR